MRTLVALVFSFAALAFAACATNDTETFHNALTGKVCTPDMTTYAEVGSHSKHAGCDEHHCCLVQNGECDHPDAGAPEGSGTGSGTGSGSGSGSASGSGSGSGGPTIP